MTLLKTSEHTDSKKQQKRVVAPLVNIHETDKEVVLQAEMPGLTKEDIVVELKGEELHIVGHRNVEEPPKGYTTLIKERFPFEYRRSFVLHDVQTDKMSARYDNGVLTITLPKAERLQPKKITIS
jgi:HSP20 family protein